MTASQSKSTVRKGWLLDVYPALPGEMTVWIISENGERVRFTDQFHPVIYVSGDRKDLEELAYSFRGHSPVSDWRFLERQQDIMSPQTSKVLELELRDCRQALSLARRILRLGGYRRYRLYNVDIPCGQYYLYHKQLFPLAFLAVRGTHRNLQFHLLDSVSNTCYRLPPLRTMWIRVETEKRGRIPSLQDSIKHFSVSYRGEEELIQRGNESRKLLDLVHTVQRVDPDLVFTSGGDSYLFPYLARRAWKNSQMENLKLGREDTPLEINSKEGGSFFSYGRTYYKAPLQRLHGRIHIDVDNSFIYPHCGLPGLIEVSRTCRVPLHRAARASIGTIMSSLQLYQALRDQILIPWKKREPESFKSGWDLLVADRGGFVFEPRIGLHQHVAEIDFSSMYPTLMATRNISGETVLCECCPESKIRVPELDYHICQKRKGIVPKVLTPVLQKRRLYKQLREGTQNPKLRQVYNQRQKSLKWILVTCFGYLGYKNSKFGRVDAHIAVCAFARDILLQAAHMAEKHGFEVIHGIVDSLWIKKEGTQQEEYNKLCRKIYQQTKVPINLKGRYRWIVFLPSKTHPKVPVLNRYYGVFQNGDVKVRGVEARRRDTPPLIREAQLEMIKVLSEASNPEEFREKIPHSLKVLEKYTWKLVNREVDSNQLLMTKRLSRHPDNYDHLVHQAIAARQLKRTEGVDIQPGQSMRYLITDAHHRTPDRRVMAAELITSRTSYDVEKYLELMFSAAANILRPFGYNIQKLRRQVLYREQQQTLHGKQETRRK